MTNTTKLCEHGKPLFQTCYDCGREMVTTNTVYTVTSEDFDKMEGKYMTTNNELREKVKQIIYNNVGGVDLVVYDQDIIDAILVTIAQVVRNARKEVSMPIPLDHMPGIAMESSSLDDYMNLLLSILEPKEGI